MVWLRSALYQAILVAVVIPYAFMVLCTAPLPRMTRWRIIAGWPRFATWLARHLLRIDYEVVGREHIPAEPVVILSKHSSAWETIAYSAIFPPHVYVLKRELLWLPFLGWGLALFSPIAINRANRKEAMRRTIELGRRRLAEGFSIMIYPEGTRIPVGKRGKYRPGGAILAVNTGAKVLPVAHNAGLVWPRNSFKKYPGHVTVKIGAPIAPEGLSAEELMRRVESWIETETAALVRQAEHVA
ncbi:MAG: 1-acyl-sn-glycerol-3-phosphate acyltransferase [Burkholderiales bacterium]|nr:1-acyl-sn-glycerol-3-phosphate acyltransferase [Burkholderiales bacterium]